VSRRWLYTETTPTLFDSLLSQFQGYLELRMSIDTNEVLENLPNELKTNAVAPHARLRLLIERGRWEAAALLTLASKGRS
jgi:hypothetical protein